MKVAWVHTNAQKILVTGEDLASEDQALALERAGVDERRVPAAVHRSSRSCCSRRVGQPIPVLLVAGIYGYLVSRSRLRPGTHGQPSRPGVV